MPAVADTVIHEGTGPSGKVRMDYECAVTLPNGVETSGRARTERTHAIVIWDGAEWSIEMLCESFTTAREVMDHLRGIDLVTRVIRPVWLAESDHRFTDLGSTVYSGGQRFLEAHG